MRLPATRSNVDSDRDQLPLSGLAGCCSRNLSASKRFIAILHTINGGGKTRYVRTWLIIVASVVNSRAEPVMDQRPELSIVKYCVAHSDKYSCSLGWWFTDWLTGWRGAVHFESKLLPVTWLITGYNVRKLIVTCSTCRVPFDYHEEEEEEEEWYAAFYWIHSDIA